MTGRIVALMPNPAPEMINEIEDLIVRLVEEAEAGEDCEALIAQLEARSGIRGWTWQSFVELDSYTSAHELAEELALGPPPAVPDLTEAEIKTCLDIIMTGDEPRSSFYRGILENSFPYSDINALLHDPKLSTTTSEMADEILRRAQSGGPVLL